MNSAEIFEAFRAMVIGRPDYSALQQLADELGAVMNPRPEAKPAQPRAAAKKAPAKKAAKK